MKNRFAFLALLSVFLALPAMTTEVKVPYTRCNGMKGTRTYNCPDPAIVTVTKEVPGPERIVIKEVKVPGPERIVTQRVEVEVQAEPKNHFLLGAGPIYKRSESDVQQWGAQVIFGGQFKSGWQLQLGPTYFKQHDFHGTVSACVDESTKAWCNPVPFTVKAGGPWGAQLALVKVF